MYMDVHARVVPLTGTRQGGGWRGTHNRTVPVSYPVRHFSLNFGPGSAELGPFLLAAQAGWWRGGWRGIAAAMAAYARSWRLITVKSVVS
jgi:hypothetical protein